MKKFSMLLSDSESLIIFGVILVATILAASFTSRYLKKLLLRKTKNEHIDITSFLFMKHVIVATIYLVGIGWGFLHLPISKHFAHTLLAGAGASTLIVGFASQQVLSNMVSGIFIIINKPCRIDDHIEIQGQIGKVIEITLHDTIIENDKKEKIIIPNSLISNSIIKNTDRK
jgi:small conductance mechanosensitive channel